MAYVVPFQADMKLNKTAKAPEKPVLPFMRYSKKVWDQVKAAHPDAKAGDIGKIVGQMWRELGDADKQEFIAEYENAKVSDQTAVLSRRPLLCLSSN